MVAIFPASTTAGGTCLAMPDVCLTPAPPGPPIPIPYPNTAMLNQATNTSIKVKFVGKEVITLKSKVPRTMGDEAGTVGGVMSGVNMGPASFRKGSSRVSVEGQDCVHLTSMSAHNGVSANSPAGIVAAPSQTKVIVAP